MLFPGLIRLFNRKSPAPTFENVIPTGRGWYKWKAGKWQRVDIRGYDDRARWLSNNKLLELALDQITAQRGMGKKRTRIAGPGRRGG